MCHCESPQECLVFSSSQTSLSLGSLCAVRVLWEALTCAVICIPPAVCLRLTPSQSSLHQCYQSDSWLLLVSLRHLELLVVTSHLSVSLVFSALDHVLALAWSALPPRSSLKGSPQYPQWVTRTLSLLLWDRSLLNSLKLFVGHILSVRL